MTSPPKSKFNAFVFTCNNYTAQHVRAIQEFVQEKGRFLLFAYELAPSGTPHLQGCFWLNEQIRQDHLFRLCKEGKQLHGFSIRTQRGDMDDQRRYILDAIKDGQPKAWVSGTTPYVWGEWPTNEEFEAQKPTQGKRSDLQAFVETVRDSRPTSRQLVESGFASVLARYPAFHLRIEGMFYPPPDSRPQMDNKWFYGDTGTGKSTRARSELKDKYGDYFLKGLNKWFPINYNGDGPILIEEWGPGHDYLLDRLKEWSDHHKCLVEIKGSEREVNPVAVYVTSQHHPREAFATVSQCDFDAFMRRFTVIHVTTL